MASKLMNKGTISQPNQHEQKTLLHTNCIPLYTRNVQPLDVGSNLHPRCCCWSLFAAGGKALNHSTFCMRPAAVSARYACCRACRNQAQATMIKTQKKLRSHHNFLQHSMPQKVTLIKGTTWQSMSVTYQTHGDCNARKWPVALSPEPAASRSLP